MKKVLLTGGTGFIGRHCIAPLRAKGYEIHLAVPPSEPLPPATGHIHAHAADLLAPGIARELMHSIRPSHLLHLAWYVKHGQFWTSPENVRWQAQSVELLEAFISAGGTRAVLAGTCAEYEWSEGPLREAASPLAPRSLYATCKDGLRRQAQELADQAKISFAWGRIFFLYGPAEDPNRFVPSILLPLLAGRRAKCLSSTLVRDLLHAADVAGAFAALLDSDTRGAANIASGQGVSLGQVARTIATIVGREDLLDLAPGPVTADNPASIVADAGLLRDAVRWRPTFDLRAGLADAIEWWKAHRLAGGPAARE